MNPADIQLPLYIFWDNSNVYISAQTVCSCKEYTENTKRVRLYFQNILRLAHANRPVTKVVFIGSSRSEDDDTGYVDILDEMRNDMNISVIMLERGNQTYTEQGVDQTLQLNMYRALCREHIPGVAVLLTGDGRGDAEDEGFLKTLQDFHNKGWGVEVLAWNRTCSRALKHWAHANGVFIPFEQYYTCVTFLEGGRTYTPLSLKNRKLSKPNYEDILAYDNLKQAYSELTDKYEAEDIYYRMFIEKQKFEIQALEEQKNELEEELSKYRRTEKYNARLKGRVTA
ncbi:MAG: NYN domain-containing protein [Desulfovibrionaceae bacterium]|nr:NYN domain-containing protein [Desulfovibrionaceae bacterium]